MKTFNEWRIISIALFIFGLFVFEVWYNIEFVIPNLDIPGIMGPVMIAMVCRFLAYIGLTVLVTNIKIKKM